MTHLLRQFVVLADTGNYTRASERLNISQPALSKNIKRLEIEFSCEIIERHNTGCFLTPFGKILYNHAKVIDNEMELLKAELKQALENHEKHLKIAWGLLWQIMFVSDILLEVEKLSDNTILITGESGITHLMQDQLLRGGCDMFLGRIPNERVSKIVHEPLIHSHHRVFAHANHPLYARCRSGDSVTLDDLSRYKWLIFGSKEDLTGYEIPMALKEKVDIHTVYDVNGFMIIVQILQKSDSLILLPYQVEPVLRNYSIYPLRTRDIVFEDFISGIMYRRDMEDNPYLQLVVKAVRSVIARAQLQGLQ